MGTKSCVHGDRRDEGAVYNRREDVDCFETSDISFITNGDGFFAHWAVLIAHSLIFKSQLLGSMADAKTSCIGLHDITSATFKIML